METTTRRSCEFTHNIFASDRRGQITHHSHCSRRKSLTGNWKTNVGQAILEEVPVQARHRAWIDLVSQMFGGLALCSLEALVTRDGTEVIIEVNDSAMGLLGESQEEDRRRIAEVVLAAMETACTPPSCPAPAPARQEPEAASHTEAVLAKVVGGWSQEARRGAEQEKGRREEESNDESPERRIISRPRHRRSDSDGEL